MQNLEKDMKIPPRPSTSIAFALATLLLMFGGLTYAQTDRPNILIIWGDDIGYWNISAYNMGMMGYKTPSIDRIAQEGMIFTDAYGEQSCTAGRASFITGQSGFRTGLLKVGLPGLRRELRKKIRRLLNT